MTQISGTKEWSVQSANCLLGCPHKCRYCYARAMALQYGKFADPNDWGESYLRLRSAEVTKRRRKVDGPVMFPTTHDIVPEYLDACLEVIQRILEAGNRLLIVSKPHLECIRAIMALPRKKWVKDQVLFRFTIGATKSRLLRYWEPGAPSFSERLECLEEAAWAGWQTSVSCEPLLDSEQVGRLVRAVQGYVTDTIWIGKMNQVRKRVIPGTDEAEIRRIEAGQTDQRVREIYAELKDHLKIRWKESYKQILGLQRPTVAGLDV